MIMSCVGLQLFPFCPEDLNIKHTDPLCVFEQVVCRACSRNRYPLKYLKDRMAKVCDHCYAELRKRGDPLFFKDRSGERSQRDVKCCARLQAAAYRGRVATRALGLIGPVGRSPPFSKVCSLPVCGSPGRAAPTSVRLASCCLPTSLFATVCSLLDIRK